jgi:putative peptide zinc metalloprotease protein
VICHSCRRQVPRNAAFCGVCGAITGRAEAGALELVLPDGERRPLTGVITIGRAEGSAVRLTDRSVSRRHARILAGGGTPILEDVGSSHGTLLDGRPLSGPGALHDGATIGVGDLVLRVERARAAAEAGRTVVVPAGAALAAAPGSGGTTVAPRVEGPGTEVRFRPRVRSGWALKRLDASEGERRNVLRDLRGGALVRMDDDDAALFRLLDGDHALPELMTEAEARLGAEGIGRLAKLLADLGERGLLEGVEGPPPEIPRTGKLAALMRPRERPFAGAGRFFERIYSGGGWVLFTPPALAVIALAIVAGIAAFAWLIVGRYGTPFVVASKVGIGGLVFLAGRFVVVALHEIAHGLVVVSFGRRVSRAGVKLMFGFPFAFVDTSEAWFEPRRRRLAISAAGPASDLFVGAVCALVAVPLAPGNFRDILFQVALAAYVGAFFNLNPLLDRDGYHMLVDALGQPGLRQRARVHLAKRLAGKPVPADSPRSLTIYGASTIVWMLAALGFVVLLSTRYMEPLQAIAPSWAIWTVFGCFYALLFVPVVLVIGRPLLERWRRPPAAVVEEPGAA